MNMNVIGQRICSYLVSRPSQLSAVRCMSVITSSPAPVESVPDSLLKTVELELRGNDPAVLKSFAKFATTAGTHFDIESKSWTLRKPIHERLTVLKSVHIYKKHRVQYETRTYYHFVQYSRLTGSTANTLLEYVQRNVPEGVALKTTKVELQKLPEHFGLEKSAAKQAPQQRGIAEETKPISNENS